MPRRSRTSRANAAAMPSYSAGPIQQAHVAVHANGSAKKFTAALRAARLHPNAAPGNYDPTDIYSSQAYDENALHNQSSCCNPAHLSTGPPAQTSIAIATAGSHFYSSDLAAWHTAYPYLAYNLNEYYIDGTPTSPDYEGTMDVEWALSLAISFGSFLDTAHIYVYSGVNAQFTTFNDIYNKILTNNTAKIVSSSWGCAENYCTSDATMNTEHSIFNAMLAQGFTMVNSSGDRGAYADCSHVSVSFPASDPDWLGIGATNLEVWWNASLTWLSTNSMQSSMKFCHLPGTPLVALRAAMRNIATKITASTIEKKTESRCSTQKPVASGFTDIVFKSNLRLVR